MSKREAVIMQNLGGGKRDQIRGALSQRGCHPAIKECILLWREGMEEGEGEKGGRMNIFIYVFQCMCVCVCPRTGSGEVGR